MPSATICVNVRNVDAESPQAAIAKRRIGSVLCGKYQVDRLLGVGGMAVVYAATHRNQKRVAIKMLHPELSLHEEIQKRFLREGYVANTVKHRGAVDVIDDDVAEDGAAFLVMEMLDGLPLDEIQAQRGGTVDAASALAIGYELCGVLQAAHDVGIVHRDIKPPNIFVTKEGELKVLDFGIARLREPGSMQATNPGMLLGTPAYMGPEQALARTEEIGPPTDVWAVAATLFNLLTGTTVHVGQSAPELLVRAATDRARSIHSLLPELPPVIGAVIDRGLRFERGERGTASEMRLAILDAYRSLFGPLYVSTVLAPLAGGTPRDSRPEAATSDISAQRASSNPVAQTMLDPIPAQETVAPLTQSFIPPLVSRRGRIIAGAAFFIVVAAGTFGVFAMLDNRPKKDTSALVQPPASQSALPTLSSTAAAATTPAPIEVMVPAPSASANPGATPTQVVYHPVFKPTATPVASIAPVVAPVASTPKIDPGSVR